MKSRPYHAVQPIRHRRPPRRPGQRPRWHSPPLARALYWQLNGNIWLRGDDTGADFPTYDSLNRLTGITRYDPSGNTVETVVYDAKGNIQNKTGVGAYHYGGDPACIAGNGAGPHAACMAGGNAYSYDANGNLIGGGGRIVGWTAWNMPGGLIQNGQTTTWLYGPEHDRYKMTAPGRTTWYMNPGLYQGGHYERTQYANGTVEHRTTLYGGGRPIGEVLSFEVTNGTAPAAQTRYFHSDHQGSITVVTDNAGAVLTRYKYDPWGKQTVVSGSNTGIAQTRQGHTGHEMLDGGLTHMNGRLYDPVLSRFVSADPYVDNPYNLQSLNRYSYVWNNPLGYTDPTGYFGWEISPSLGRGLFTLGGIMFGAVLGPAGPIFGGGGMATTLASGALAGGVGGFIGSGGNAQAARQGALAGGLFAGAGLIGNGLEKAGYAGFANDGMGRALLHAGAGCISASAGGGSCGTGAMTAGFTKFASAKLPDYGDIGNLVKYAVIGGTASVIGGGKFANGAMTGAWQYLFNEAASKKMARIAIQQAGATTGRLNTKFEHDLFDRYFGGTGHSYGLNNAEFQDIVGYASNQTPTSSLLVSDMGGNFLIANQYSFYRSPTYDYSFGVATIFFNEYGQAVGFWDNYNFNPSNRASDAEWATRTVGKWGAYFDAKPFDITYGNYVPIR